MLFGNIADGPQGVNDPRTAPTSATAFRCDSGYTIVWSGWDPDAPRANMGLGLTAPVATDNGKAIVKAVRDEFCSGTRGGALESFRLSYEDGDAREPRARLTVRERAATSRARRSAGRKWSFVDARHQACRRQAQAGLALRVQLRGHQAQGAGPGVRRDARRRELPALRRGAGLPRPAGRSATHSPSASLRPAATCATTSPTASIATKQGRKVFDGIHAHIAGIGRIFFNTPFGQPARTGTQHEDHGFPENDFPFSTAVLSDPLTGKTGSLFRGDGCDRC